MHDGQYDIQASLRLFLQLFSEICGRNRCARYTHTETYSAVKQACHHTHTLGPSNWANSCAGVIRGWQNMVCRRSTRARLFLTPHLEPQTHLKKRI